MNPAIVLALMLIMFSCGIFIGHAAGYRRGIVTGRAPRYRRVGTPE